MVFLNAPHQPFMAEFEYQLPCMKTDQIVEALEQAARQLGLRVRREKGNFKGGRCRVKGEGMVLLNKLHPPEVHLTVLAESLRQSPIDTIFLRPAVRDALENTWARS